MKTRARTISRFGRAWLALTLCFAVHVADEALTGFLDVYIPVARAIRARLPFLPFPTFTLRTWLALLVTGIILLLGLSVFAYRGRGWIVYLAYPFGILMLFNGAAHLAGSAFMRRLMPGVYSAPLLLASSRYLLIAARRMRLAIKGVAESRA